MQASMNSDETSASDFPIRAHLHFSIRQRFLDLCALGFACYYVTASGHEVYCMAPDIG